MNAKDGEYGGPPPERPEADDDGPAFEGGYPPLPAEPGVGTPSGDVPSAGDTLVLDSGVARTGWPNIPGVELKREIGRGGMGVVYLGTQTYLERRVAVKVLSGQHGGPTYSARFQREAKILASLSHPNIVSCYSAGTLADGQCYLIMQFIDGPNLFEWLEDNGALPLERALAVCRDVAKALACAHEASIIHRDVKPANVLLQPADDPEGVFPYKAKLADLGLARPTDPGVTMMELTVQGAVMGSPPTMAPEQFDDPDNVDYRVDIYGLGCLLFHMLTGNLAYPQKTLTATIAKKMQAHAPDPRKIRANLPHEVAEFVRSMLARDKNDRPQSYAAIVETCDTFLSTTFTPTKEKRSLLPWALAFAVLGGAAFGVWRWRAGADPSPSNGTDVAALTPEDGSLAPLAGAGTPETQTDPDPPKNTEPQGQAGTGASDTDATQQATDPASGGETAAGVPPEEPADEPADPDAANGTPPANGVDATAGTNASTPVELDPGPRLYPALEEGASLPLISFVESDPSSDPLANWTVELGDNGAWSAQTERAGAWVVGRAPREALTASHLLVEGDWRLEGHLELVSPKYARTPPAAQVRIEFDRGPVWGVELARIDGGVATRAGEFEEVDGRWTLTKPLEALQLERSFEAYDDAKDSKFVLMWAEGELLVRWDIGSEADFGTVRAEDGIAGRRPLRVVMSVLSGLAQFEGMVLTLP